VISSAAAIVDIFDGESLVTWPGLHRLRPNRTQKKEELRPDRKPDKASPSTSLVKRIAANGGPSD
jgi:hypothetical protein